MVDALHRLEATIHNEIPLTRAIGLSVEAYDERCVTLRAPLAPNINHKDTAFAGSLNAVATLAGWSLIWLIIDAVGLQGKIVIQDSSIQYRRPVTTAFSARCCAPDERTVTRFVTMLQRKRRARLELATEIWENDVLAVHFAGRYVVDLAPSPMHTHQG